ncbi:MAG: hypothetical protein ACI8ZB_003816 [Desulforhopalus sp.]|jgi:hypothetical protein
MVDSKFLLATVGKVLGAAKAPITKFCAKYKTKKKAFKGENLFGQGDYYQLVKKELERLSVARDLPVAFQSEQCRHWLTKEENIKLFAKVFLARRAECVDTAKNAEKQLAIDYEESTGETRKLAPGRVELAINFVYGQLIATDEGIQSLQLAYNQFVAGELLVLTQPGPPVVPSDDEIPHLKAMAEAIIKSAEHIWRVPQFVAPLSLEMRIPEKKDDVFSTDTSKLVDAIQAGENIVVHGSGGIGKTTLLLEMCKTCLSKKIRIPLYIDVAAWSSKNIGLFEYIEALPAATSNGITSAKLTKLAEIGKLVIILNGWNEVSPKSKRDCSRSLTELIVTAEALNIVVVSRSDKDIPNSNFSKKIMVRGLSWEGQQKIVRERLEEKLAGSLLDFLGRDNHLRHSARSPLILGGLVSCFSSGGDTENISNYDLLGASIESFETDIQRNTALSTEPIEFNQTAYLEKIACFLTDQQTTTCSREEALMVFNSAAKQLQRKGQISTLPNLSAILDVLSNHHLLHLDSDIVRFAHQRFQEYFAAKRILGDCLETSSSTFLLKGAMNKVSWDEVFDLVAEKFKGKEDKVHARVRLIKVAKDIDLGLACDLIRICAFSRTDDLVLHDLIADRVNALAASPFNEIKDLGVRLSPILGPPS